LESEEKKRVWVRHSEAPLFRGGRQKPVFQMTTKPSLLNVKATLIGLVARCSGNAFDPINEVTVRRARLVLRWVTACGQVNHLGM